MDYRKWLEFAKRVGEMKMKENNQGIDLYPNVILSDCVITKISLNDIGVVVGFSAYGFIKKEDDNKYYRTDGAEIVIEGLDMDNISIKEIRTQQLSEELYFDSMYDISTKDFCEKINSKEWKFEVVEEFYSTGGAMYIGQIRNGNKPFWCYIKIRYTNLRYLWNNVRYDW